MNRKGVSPLPFDTATMLVINGIILGLIVVVVIVLVKLFASSGEEVFRAQQNVNLLADKIDYVVQHDRSGQADAAVVLDIPLSYRLMLWEDNKVGSQFTDSTSIYAQATKPRSCDGQACICIIRDVPAEQLANTGPDPYISYCRRVNVHRIEYVTYTPDLYLKITQSHSFQNPTKNSFFKTVSAGPMNVQIFYNKETNVVYLMQAERLDCSGNVVANEQDTTNKNIYDNCNGKQIDQGGKYYGINYDENQKPSCYSCEQTDSKKKTCSTKTTDFDKTVAICEEALKNLPPGVVSSLTSS